MKKYYFQIFFAIAFVMFAAPMAKALAFDGEAVPTYFQQNNVYVDQAGNLQINWQKIQLGLGGYSLGNRALIFSIDGRPATSSLYDIYSNGAGQGGLAIQYQGGWEQGMSQPLISAWDGNCRSEHWDNYGGASTNPNSNNVNSSQIWDSTGNDFVNTSGITANTAIYVTLIDLNHSGCGVDPEFSTSPQGMVSFLPNSVQTLFSLQYVTPANSSTIGNFPNWAANIVNNSSTAATGTITFSYGLSTSTLQAQVSSTFYANPGNTPISIANNYPFVTPQVTSSVQWWYQAQITNASTGLSLTFPYQTFTINPNGNGCDVPLNVSLSNPFPSSTIYNDFNNWTINTDPLLEGCSYTLQVSYSPQVGSLTGGTDQTTLNITPSGPESPFNITKGKNIWNFYNATTTQINFVVQLLNNADGYTVGSDIGRFYLGYASSSNLTAPAGFNPSQQCGGVCQGFGTVGGGSIATPTSTIAATGAQCSPPADFTDIGGGIAYGFCSTINFLFVPNATTQGILAGDMNSLQSVPPFSWFFATNNYIIQGAGANNQTTPDNGVSFQYYTGINMATSTVTLLPANLTSNSFLSDGRLVDDYYNLILTFCIVFAIIMVYKIAL